MPPRKTLGANIGGVGGPGGMMAALGFAANTPPPAPEPRPAAEAAEPPPPSGHEEHRPSPAVARRAPPREPAPPPGGAPAPGTLVRITTDISAEMRDLARRAAYWHRETLRSFLERAIETEARRIEKEHDLSPLPELPERRPGQPLCG